MLRSAPLAAPPSNLAQTRRNAGLAPGDGDTATCHLCNFQLDLLRRLSHPRPSP